MDSSLFGYSPEDFKEEARELLSRAETIISGLRDNPTDPEGINALFRVIHSVKGSSAYVGFADVNTFAHVYESFLSDLRRKKYVLDGDMLNVLERSRDFLEDLVFHPEKSKGLSIDDSIEDSYLKVKTALGAQGAAASAKKTAEDTSQIAFVEPAAVERIESRQEQQNAFDAEGMEFIDDAAAAGLGSGDFIELGQNEVIRLTLLDCIKNFHDIISSGSAQKQEAFKVLSKMEETAAWAFGDESTGILLPLEEMKQLVSGQGALSEHEAQTLKRGFNMLVPAIKKELGALEPAAAETTGASSAVKEAVEENEEASKIRGASREEILNMTVKRNLEALTSFLDEGTLDAILIQRILTKLREVNSWAFGDNEDINTQLNVMADLLLRAGEADARTELGKRCMALRTLFTRVLSEEKPQQPARKAVSRADEIAGVGVTSIEASSAEQTAQQAPPPGIAERRKAPRSQPGGAPSSLKIRSEDLEELITTVGKVKGLDDKDMEVLQSATLKLRMVPVGELFTRFRKVVRDLSESLGKPIVIDIAGESVKLDKAIADKLVEPVMHMVRNAASHGIESQKERDALGKGQAIIKLNAYQEGGQVVIEVSDNGKGISAEKIRKRALEMNLVEAEVLKAMPDKKVIELIFTPGFSTKEGADSVSGRGVGMDVVKEAVTSLQGAIQIDTKEGVGTLFKLQLPLTLAIIRAMVLEQSGVKIAVPAGAVDRVMNMNEQELEQGTFLDKNRLSLYLPEEGEVMPLVNISKMFGLEKAADKRCVVLIKVGGGHKVALVVDAALGRQPLTVKPLDKFSETRYFSSASMVEDEVVLILNIPSLLAA